MAKVGRNDPCPCGSGRKHKKCCLVKSTIIDPTPPNDQELQGITTTSLIPGTKRPTINSFVWKNRRWRSIWSTLYHGPLSETFHDFLIGSMMRTLSKDWINAQKALPIEQRHVVVRWLEALKNLSTSSLKVAPGAYVASGPIQAALQLAYDLYFLQLVNRLPNSLIERLRDAAAFQGARYEVAVASLFARANFEIELLDESVKLAKHCEFTAKHKYTGTEVYVEAKSRVRRGVLHEPGNFDENIAFYVGVLVEVAGFMEYAPGDAALRLNIGFNASIL